MELTEEGQLFLDKARAILASMEDVEESIRIRRQKLRPGACPWMPPTPFMLHCVVPHVAEFRAMYPDIRLELTSNDQIADLLEHRTDIAIRIGALVDSTLRAPPAPVPVLCTCWPRPPIWRATANPPRRSSCPAMRCWALPSRPGQQLAAAPRCRQQPADRACAGRVQRRNPAPAGAA